MSFCPLFILFFFFNDTATTEIYTLSLHDALPICQAAFKLSKFSRNRVIGMAGVLDSARFRTFIAQELNVRDRKSTRLNSSHSQISYAVFCLKKKKKHNNKS